MPVQGYTPGVCNGQSPPLITTCSGIVNFRPIDRVKCVYLTLSYNSNGIKWINFRHYVGC